MPHRPFSQPQYNPFRQPSESAPEDSAPWPAHLPAPPRRPPRCNKAESRITRNQISFPSPIQTLESAFCHEMPVWGRAPSPVPPSAAKRAPPQLRKATGFNPPKRIAGRLQPPLLNLYSANPGSPSTLRRFFSCRYAFSPSGPFFRAQAESCSRSPSYLNRGTPYPHESLTRVTSTRIIDRTLS